MTELYFKGKEFVYNHHLAVPHRPLVPDAGGGRSVGPPDLSGNLIIQGDNLHALKALMPVYAGKVDCIFIDPPYNTGNEGWRYNDRVNAPMIKQWLEDNPVGVEDGLRHDKWCAMMWPRLKLLYELLAEDGVIFVMIDENEAHNLRCILDEVFGSENYVGTVARQALKGGTGPTTAIRRSHDYIIAFSKDSDSCVLQGQVNELLPLDSEDEQGLFRKGREMNKWGAGSRREDSPSMWFPITGPSGEDVYPIRNDGSEGRWRWGKQKLLKAVEDRNLIFEPREDGTFIVYEKIRTTGSGFKAFSSLFNDNLTNASGTLEIKGIFDGKSPFEYAKPSKLVEVLIHISNLTDNALILDSFAGSGTTAHATLKANAEDGGNRRFILVEMEADIADAVTAERIRRVIAGYEHNGKTTAGLGGTFTYCTLGEAIDLDKILTGETLPPFNALAPVLFHMATSHTLKTGQMDESQFYVGKAAEEHVWMIYRPDLDWLKSDQAALTLSKAKEIFDTYPAARHLVFAPARFVSEKLLREEGLKVAFIPFPDSLYRIAREG